MQTLDRDGLLAIVASLLVLFSAMLNPLLTVVLAALVLLAALVYRSRSGPRSRN